MLSSQNLFHVVLVVLLFHPSYVVRCNDEELISDLVNSLYMNDGTEMRMSREKKSDKDNLTNHGRKNFFVDTSSTLQCQASGMVVETNVMVDSKKSLALGAKFLQVEKVGFSSGSTSLSELHESCSKVCCENEDGCDTALLSLRVGEEGYRCYLFRCNEKCMFIKHADYVVLHKKSPEQFGENSQSNNKVITGENQNSKNLCNMKFEFKCGWGEPKCIPIYDVCDSIAHCADKSDEKNCTSPNSAATTKKANADGNDEQNSAKKPSKSGTASSDLINDDQQYDSAVQQSNNNDYGGGGGTGSDDYDDYTLKLIKQQNGIIKHLKELEDVWQQEASNPNAKKTENNDESKPVFKTPAGYLESFLRPGPSTISSTKKTTTKSTMTTKKASIYFHDQFNSEDSMYGSSSDDRNGDRLLFVDDEAKGWSVRSGTTTAILLLILGCALVVAFFVYLLMSTRFVRKKIKWASVHLPGTAAAAAQKNVDVDGDYLINGMYL